MIIFQCDICKRKFVDTNKLESIVLYSKTIDYCENCKKEAERTFDNMKQEIKFRNNEYDLKLKQYEGKLIKNTRIRGEKK